MLWMLSFYYIYPLRTIVYCLQSAYETVDMLWSFTYRIDVLTLNAYFCSSVYEINPLLCIDEELLEIDIAAPSLWCYMDGCSVATIRITTKNLWLILLSIDARSSNDSFLEHEDTFVCNIYQTMWLRKHSWKVRMREKRIYVNKIAMESRKIQHIVQNEVRS
jgi:hypothetical protein